MKLRGLSLLAYGPFTGAALNLSAPGLHVLFGRNEAGKSTALRAVTGLLFGIDVKTQDAHVHAMKDLRIGGVLEGDAASKGDVLRVVRRKGTANTLLDAQGKAIDDAPLKRMLGGVGVELFRTMFGLNHETLRHGGEALALGKGDVGESLFGASLGREVHEVLRELRQEREALFVASANATRPTLNAALRAFNEAQRNMRALEGSPAILVQEEGLAREHAARAACEVEKRETLAAAARVRRARDVRPLLTRRDALLARRAALGDVPLLPEDAAQSRETAAKDRLEAELKIERLTKERDALATERAALAVPDDLVDREDLVDDLQERLGGHRKSLLERPRLVAELAGLEESARALLARLGRPLDLAAAEGLRVDAARQAAIKKLALAHARLEGRAESAEEERVAKERALAEKRAELGASASPVDVGALRRAASRAQPHGDIDERARRAAADAKQKEGAAATLLARLGLFRGTIEEARALTVPAGETVERFAQRVAELERATAKLAERTAANDARAAQAAREVDALRRSFAVPTEEDLAASRARRGDAWAKLRVAWDDARARAFEGAVAEADTIADRLRHEADRVARLAAFEAERAACAAEDERASRERAEHGAARATLDEEWRAAWADVPFEPLSPVEMRAWGERHARLEAAVDQLRAAEIERERVAAEAGALREVLAAALVSAGEPVAATEDVTGLLARATERAEELEAVARERAGLERSVSALEREVETARREQSEGREALAAWRAAWTSEVAAIGLAGSASPEEATTVLDDLATLSRALDDARRTRHRAEAIDRDAAAFAADVEKRVRAYAPDLAGQAPDHAAASLVKLQASGRAARAEQRRYDALLVEKRAALAEQQERRALAALRQDAMMTAARVGDLAALEPAERASAEARDIATQLRTVDDRLNELGYVPPSAGAADGDPLEHLDADALEARADELSAKLDELDHQHRALERTIGGLESGLAAMRKESAAAQAASDAQAHLARVRSSAERYARVRLAEVLLEREIERHRERHQGPVLARASALFSRMTLGAFASLRVGYDDKDQPVLRAVRAAPLGPGGDVEAEIRALSDGTRDQLYLALRLATLERYAETSAPLPLVVDDILVHFDDERARAALTVLGEITPRIQVLLFTHHARVVELAREALGGGVVVHPLGAVGARTSVGLTP